MFIKRSENFVCENCAVFVKGSGYTNHCPQCLWSKHVDIDPGDRAEACQSMMKPIAVEQKGKEERILHRCTKCDFERYNKVQEGDRREKLLEIAEAASQ